MSKEREVYKEYEKTLLLIPNFIYRIRKLYPSTLDMAFLQETLTHILNDTPRKKLNPKREPFSNSRDTVLFSTMHHRFHYMGQRLHTARIESKTNEELDAIINDELQLINTMMHDAMMTIVEEVLGLDNTRNDTGTREKTPST